MTNNDIFVSVPRPQGEFAAVFECDDDVGFLYILNLKKEKNYQIIGSIRVSSGMPDFSEQDVSLVWDKSGSGVGLYIGQHIWAAFILPNKKYGGNYISGGTPNIPRNISSNFQID